MERSQEEEKSREQHFVLVEPCRQQFSRVSDGFSHCLWIVSGDPLG